MVAQRIRSSSSGFTPARSSAWLQAVTSSWVSVSSVQTARSRMPVRWLIHSSLVSRKAERSSLLFRHLGRALPVESI